MDSAGHTVFILGAGASLAEALARRPMRPKEHPPLDATFFRKAASHAEIEGLLDKVVQQAQLLGETNLTSHDPPVRLEAHLGRLYFEMTHNPLRTGVQAYFDAVRLYASEIIRTTNWMMGKAGLMKRVFQAELRAGRRVSIVTFNIDLLAENALHCLTSTRQGAPWCLNLAYGFSGPRPLLVATGKDYEREFPSNGTDASVRLFKMHGSVNWVFQHRDAHPPADLLGKGRSFSIVTNERLPPDRMTYVTSKQKGRTRWYLSPLIIPPVYEKHNLITRHLQEVWDGASQALLDADRVVFWGYSFPDADTHARHYFQGLSTRNTALRRPVTINPDPLAESALWDVLKPHYAGHFRAAQGFLEA